MIGILFVLYVVSCSSGEGSSPSPSVTDSSQPPSSVGDLVFSDHGFKGVSSSFKVAWTKPTNSGMDENNTNIQLAGYRVSWGTSPERLGNSFETSNPEALFHTIPDLTPGTQYYVKVQAKNDNTKGNTYNVGSSGSTYTIKPPGAVMESTIIYREHTTNKFQVEWEEVTDAGYGPEGALTSVGYLIEWSSDQEGTWKEIARSDYQTNTETLSGLNSGISYRVRITTTNGFSSALPTEGRGGYTRSLPGKVSGLTVSHPSYDQATHTGGFTVTWPIPMNTGLSATGKPAAITGYQVAYREVGVPGDYISVTHKGTNAEHVFTNLNPNTEYNIRIEIKTAVGTGPVADVSGWTPSLPGKINPDSITFTNATASTIRITWGVPPSGKAGGPSDDTTTTLYKVEIALDDGSDSYTLVRDDYSGNVITVENLISSTNYFARITPLNKWGEADASVSTVVGTTVAPNATPPSAVVNLKVDSFTHNQVVLSWTAPTNAGTINIANVTNQADFSGYVVKYKETGDDLFTEINEKSVGVRLAEALTTISTDATVVGLTGNTKYTFLVVAINSGNAIGPDTEDSRIEQLTIPAPPENLKKPNTCDKTTSLDLVWDASSGATYYKLYRDGSQIASVTNKTSYTDTRLTAGKEYTYKVQSCSAIGCSGDSDLRKIATFKDKSFKSIIESGKVPVDFAGYDEMSRDIFSHYKTNASIVVKYLKPGGSGDGNSFSNATGNARTVLEKIDAKSTNIYAVLLSGGTYQAGGEIVMKNHVAIIGGVDECLDPSETITSLDGQDSYRVFRNDGVDSTALLYGVTIANGKADKGGGMYNYKSSPTLVEVTFSGNTANGFGGGIYNDQSSPSLERVTFSGNTSVGGGGIYNVNSSSPSLVRVTFSGNEANGDGLNDGNGGGIYNRQFSSPSLIEVAFSGNRATKNGGGIYNVNSSSPSLERVTFSGNTANRGGGIYNDGFSSSLVGVTFSENTADYGAGIFNKDSSPTLVGVTFFGNTAINGGGMYNNNNNRDGPLIINSIFWSNTANSGSQFYFYNDKNNGRENLGLYSSIVEEGIGTLVSGTTYTNVNQVGLGSDQGLILSSAAVIAITFSNIIADYPELGELADNGGSVLTHAITETSSAVDQGLYVKRKGNTFYYSGDNMIWYSDPGLTTVATLPTDAVDLTDATGQARDDRPDLGAYEAR